MISSLIPSLFAGAPQEDEVKSDEALSSNDQTAEIVRSAIMEAGSDGFLSAKEWQNLTVDRKFLVRKADGGVWDAGGQKGMQRAFHEARFAVDISVLERLQTLRANGAMDVDLSWNNAQHIYRNLLERALEDDFHLKEYYEVEYGFYGLYGKTQEPKQIWLEGISLLLRTIRKRYEADPLFSVEIDPLVLGEVARLQGIAIDDFNFIEKKNKVPLSTLGNYNGISCYEERCIATYPSQNTPVEQPSQPIQASKFIGEVQINKNKFDGKRIAPSLSKIGDPAFHFVDEAITASIQVDVDTQATAIIQEIKPGGRSVSINIQVRAPLVKKGESEPRYENGILVVPGSLITFFPTVIVPEGNLKNPKSGPKGLGLSGVCQIKIVLPSGETAVAEPFITIGWTQKELPKHPKKSIKREEPKTRETDF